MTVHGLPAGRSLAIHGEEDNTRVAIPRVCSVASHRAGIVESKSEQVGRRRGALEPRRVSVFLDYQNVYRSARRAFALEQASHVEGQIKPMTVGLRARDLQPDRVLSEVVVFRGMPSPTRDPKGYDACQRQIAKWNATAHVRVVTRPINYRDPQRPREKGIDVALAIEMVAGAIRGLFDVAVLFSGDTDLLPAAEFVKQHLGNDAIEFAAWKPVDGSPARVLQIDGLGARYHIFDRSWYDGAFRDDVDYTRRSRRR